MSVLDFPKSKRTPEPPRHDEAAEKSVLGSILLDNSCLDTVRGIITPAAFYHPAHATIFECMVAVGGRGEPVDVVTLCAELRGRERLNTVGGMQYLGELTDYTPSIANAANHARIVRQHHEGRAVAGILREALAALDRGPLDTAKGLLVTALDRCTDANSKGSRSYAEIAQTWIAGVELAMHTGKLPGVPTGLAELDRSLGGLQPGQVCVLGARPRMGKSAAAITIAERAAQEGAVLVVSLEMTALELFGRSAGARSRVDSSRLKLGQINHEELGDLYAACDGLSQLPVEIEDASEMTLLDVKASATRLRAKYGSLSLVVIDYLQLLTASGREGTRENEVGEISRGLKRLAKSLGVPVLVLAQLNRQCDTRPEHRPQLSDLRDSGAIEQDADVVMFMYRDEIYNKDTADKGIAEIIVAKQRNGPTGTVRVKWEGKWMQFSDLESPQETGGKLPSGEVY